MDNEYIKLPMSFGLEISKLLSSKYNIEPRKNKFGMISLEYTTEELSNITELVITNPARNMLDGIESLKGLKRLSIHTFMDSDYRQNKSIASISSKDMDHIKNISSLEELEIINQNGIHKIDVSNLKNLKKLNINENTNLDELVGLEQLKQLETLKIYENKNLFKIDNLNEVIKQNNLQNLVLGLLYFSDSVNYDPSTFNIDMDSLEKMVSLSDNCCFIEVPSNLVEVYISPTDALKMHQKCITILNNKFTNPTDTLGYIIGVEEYLTRNVTFDFEALRHNNTHLKEVEEIGSVNGSNSMYNAIMYKTCTCEGYPRAMVYLLKQLGIKSHIVNCSKDKDSNIILNNPYFVLPDDGLHSVVTISDYYNLYCDPCWDASKYNSGDSNFLPFTLLSKEEISRTHTLMYDEKSTGNETLTVPRKIIETYLKSYNELKAK